jgi:hypothetical protein
MVIHDSTRIYNVITMLNVIYLAPGLLIKGETQKYDKPIHIDSLPFSTRAVYICEPNDIALFTIAHGEHSLNVE